MFNKSDFEFLTRILTKNRIRYAALTAEKILTGELNSRLGTLSDLGEQLRAVLPSLNEGVIYRLTDEYDCAYRIMKLGDTEEIFTVGPFLEEHITEERIGRIRELLGLSFQRMSYLLEYFRALPILTDTEGALSALAVFAERTFETQSVKTADIFNTGDTLESPFSGTMLNIEPADTLVAMKAIERRYEYENELMSAVSHGKSDVLEKFSSVFNDAFFEKRSKSPLRNGQNYCIIMNTLLRKAAERGDVHPMYLDRISSDFAMRIEALSEIGEIAPLMKTMFSTYCRLVKDESMKNLSSIVKETALIIDGDLSADISPGKLARALGVSLGYLSAVFKREMGKTMSTYIRERRMEYADYLLLRTDLQIQNVALHCGIMDVQYFSKLFRAHFGKTPTEYRKTKQGEIKQ